MNDKGLLLCAASMLGLGVWRHWLAAQGGIRLRGNIVVWVILGGVGVAAGASRYLLNAADAALAIPDPVERTTTVEAHLARAMTASATALVCLALGAVVLGGLTFAHRRREARR